MLQCCKISCFNFTIHHFHIDHNAPCLPPKILHNHCFQSLLGITVITREIQDNGYAKFCGVNRVLYCLWENGEFLFFISAYTS